MGASITVMFDSDDSVRIVTTAAADVRVIVRLMRAFAAGLLLWATTATNWAASRWSRRHPGVPPGLTRQLVPFAAVSVASTLAHLALFVLLRDPAGVQGANAVALLITAVVHTALNRRFTFAVRGVATALRAARCNLLPLQGSGKVVR